MAADAAVARFLPLERWIALVRLLAVVLVAVEVGLVTRRFPSDYETWAWSLTAGFAVLALVLFVLSGADPARRGLGLFALAADVAIVGAYGILFSYEWGSQTRWALIFVVVEAALRYGLLGGAVLPVLLLPYLHVAELWRAEEFGPPDYHLDRVTFPFGVLLLTGLITGGLVLRLRSEAHRAGARAEEAERLRDELGHRVDLFEAANRCASALNSSLELDAAFDAFIRQLRPLVPFDRTVILLEEDGLMRVMAVSGVGEEAFLPRGSEWDTGGSILDVVFETGEAHYRPDMSKPEFPEEEALRDLGLHARVIAPLPLGERPIGALSVVRREPNSFRKEEIELIALLGRLVATAVQNIRTYAAERATVDELRRLSALRADFVSLVSHELRSPMAAVIGSARTLQQRWRELRPQQREAFLAVIGDETSRLANLVGDVLDTSRIEAGTFGYAFAEVDLAGVLRDAVSAAAIGQDDVRLKADIPSSLPSVLGDRDRLRQLLDNLISNALKYSRAGGEIDVAAHADSRSVRVQVRDSGPGIPVEQQGLIFEKFGRASGRDSKPGTGLGLFIARSFAEGHGGSLDVESAPGEGATFTLTLPREPHAAHAAPSQLGST